MAEVKKD
jgi:small subunit ribosomal protein S14e